MSLEDHRDYIVIHTRIKTVVSHTLAKDSGQVSKLLEVSEIRMV